MRTEAEREAAVAAGGVAMPVRSQVNPGDAAWTEDDQFIMELGEAQVRDERQIGREKRERESERGRERERERGDKGVSVRGRTVCAHMHTDTLARSMVVTQQSKRAFKMPVVEELPHNPPSAALTALPSVVSWYAPRDRNVTAQNTAQKLYRAPAAEPAAPVEYPKEWYGKHELAKSVQLPGDEEDAFGTYNYYQNYGAETGIKIANVDEEYNKQYARVQAARQKAFTEEAQRRGCSVSEVAAEADRLARERRARARKAAGLEAEEDPVLGDPVHAELVEQFSGAAGEGGGEEDDLPPLEDVDVTELQFTEGRSAPMPSIHPRKSAAPDDGEADADAPPDLEDVDMTERAEGLAGGTSAAARAFFAESDEQVLASTGGDARQFKTQYEKDNHATQGLYNRELEAAGGYQTGVSSKTQERGEGQALGDFVAADAYSGSRKGMVFKHGESGLGYYRDYKYGGAAETSSDSPAPCPAPVAEKSGGRKAFVEEVVEEEEEAEAISTSAPTYGDGGIDDLD